MEFIIKALIFIWVWTPLFFIQRIIVKFLLSAWGQYDVEPWDADMDRQNTIDNRFNIITGNIVAAALSIACIMSIFWLIFSIDEVNNFIVNFFTSL